MIDDNELEQDANDAPGDDPRNVILAFRDFLLDWHDGLNFFWTGTGKIGRVLHVEKEMAPEGESLDDRLIALGEQTTTVRQAISTALQAIKSKVAQLHKGAEKREDYHPELFRNKLAAALPDLIKAQMKIALAQVEQISGPQMFNAYRKLCKYDMILDILTSELHRLDPVIGDHGCQWRAPFVMDLHDAVHEMLAGVYGEGYHDQINEAASEYQAVRVRLPSQIDILNLCARSNTVRVKKSNSSIYTLKKIAPLYRGIMGFGKSLKKEAPNFTKLRKLVEQFMKSWLRDEIPEFNALEYIQLCKLLTANRIRTLDEFGLSGVPDSVAVPDERRTLSPCVKKLSRYSLDYMTYVCEESCTLADLNLNYDGYAEDPEDETRIHVVGSALKLMKDARFLTLQKSAFYQTNVCYGPTRAIFARQAQRGQPIIIDLRRLICRPDVSAQGGYRYSYNGGAILYFEPQDGRFVHVADDELSDIQRRKAGLVCEACSMVLVDGTVPSEEDPDRVFATLDFGEYMNAILTNCHIVDLIMYGLSSHPELPGQMYRSEQDKKKLPDEEVNEMVIKAYMEATGRSEMPKVDTGEWSLIADYIPFPDGVKPDCDLLLEKARFLSILRKFDATTSQYKRRVKGDPTKANRNAETMPFAPIHIYGSTYARKMEELAEAENFIYSDAFQNEQHGLRLMTLDQCRPRNNQ